MLQFLHLCSVSFLILVAAMGLLEPDELERELEQRNDEREEMLRKIKVAN